MSGCLGGHTSCGWFGRKMQLEVWEGDVVLPPPALPACSRSLGEPRLPYQQIAEQIISEHSLRLKTPLYVWFPQSSVQTLWHHGADCWGNILLGWERRGRAQTISNQEKKIKKKQEKEKGTHNNSLFQQGGGEGKFRHSFEMLPVCVTWGRERVTGRVCPCVLLQQPLGTGNS